MEKEGETMTEGSHSPERSRRGNAEANPERLGTVVNNKQPVPTLAKDNQGEGQDGAGAPPSPPWAFVVVVIAIVCVTGIFLAVWLIPTPKVFGESSQVIAVLSSTFAVIGTLVGTYFGIKTSGDARDSIERVHKSMTNDVGTKKPR
jgi:hypothetical protein